jgi:hypothetical protein
VHDIIPFFGLYTIDVFQKDLINHGRATLAKENNQRRRRRRRLADVLMKPILRKESRSFRPALQYYQHHRREK